MPLRREDAGNPRPGGVPAARSRGESRCFPTRAWLVLLFRPHQGAVAQLVARLVRNEKARGSNPLSSTTDTLSDLRKRRSMDRVSCYVATLACAPCDSRVLMHSMHWVCSSHSTVRARGDVGAAWRPPESVVFKGHVIRAGARHVVAGGLGSERSRDSGW